MRNSGASPTRAATKSFRTGLAVWFFVAVLAGSAGFPFQGLCGAAQAAEGQSGRFAHPVMGPIDRHYEEPPGPYASGHRGIDYGVPSGSAVRASNDGKVIFAGPVAGQGLFVTVEHAGGFETLYSYMSRVTVQLQDQVARGQLIGASGAGHPGEGRDGLHFGMKQSGRYIDPEPLLNDDGNDISNAIGLVPTDEPGSDENTESRSSPQGSYSGGSASGQPGYFSSGDGFEGQQPSARGFGSTPPRGGGFGTERSEGPGAGPDRPKGRGSGTNSPNGRGFGTESPNASGFETSGFYTTSPEGSPIVARWQRMGRFLAGDYDTVKPENSDGARSKKGPVSGFDAIFSSKAVRLWTAKLFDRAGSSVDPSPDSGLFGAVKGLAGGLLHQVGCNLKGGAKPPAMPTTEQLNRRSAKPPPAPNKNVVVVIGGLNSNSMKQKNGEIKGSSSMFDMDMRTLGYKPNQIYHYSYKGLEKRGGTSPYRLHALYKKEDTYKRIRTSSKLLSDQIQEIHKQNPGRKIDLVGHSEGGLVADYFVHRLLRKNDPRHAQIDHLVTVNTPHEGADLARAPKPLSETAIGRTVRPVVEWPLTKFLGAPPASAPVLKDAQEDSTFIRDLKANWDPKKVKATTIGSALDVVVPANHTRLPSSDHYTTDIAPHVLPFSSHGLGPTSPKTKGIVYNALADRPSQCTAFKNAVAQHVTGPGIATLEDGVILGAGWTFKGIDFAGNMGYQSYPPALTNLSR